MSNGTVNRSYLAEEVHKKLGLSRLEASEIIDLFINKLVDGIESYGEVKLVGFGNFKVNKKKERIGRNPKTKEEAVISARKVVSFYPSPILKKRLNK